MCIIPVPLVSIDRYSKAKKAAALAQTYQAIDPEADARLQKEAELEEKTINRICDGLGVQIHEVKLEITFTLFSLLIYDLLPG